MSNPQNRDLLVLTKRLTMKPIHIRRSYRSRKALGSLFDEIVQKALDDKQKQLNDRYEQKYELKQKKGF